MEIEKLIDEVRALIDQVEKTHRYPMSTIYDLSNRVFNKKEKPQSCASCLIRKVRELEKWLKGQIEVESFDLPESKLTVIIEKSDKEEPSPVIKEALDLLGIPYEGATEQKKTNRKRKP